ncbi:hypothetical protein BYT27DRAFT_7198749 [Phlegmacium glaucopus]|nr:hypothetical protein BYT27DRAFT_7198749 [Phlegmacium glaucopus]
MPINLSTTYLGGCSAAVLLQGGSATRIYYQAADGAIHEAAGTGPAVDKPTYTDRVVVTAPDVRINSPMAAVTWKDGEGVEQIRLYFIDQSNLLHEYVGTSDTSSGFADGYLTGHQYMATANSGLLYALFTAGPNIRVGYQAANDPAQITETTNTSGPWDQGSFN